MGLIPAWSFSRLAIYEKCPYQLKLQVVDKAPQVESPAADRGTAIHASMEDYITGKKKDFLPELNSFAPELSNLRTRYKQGQVEVEQNWAFDSEWNKVDNWGDDKVWCRVKLDAMVSLSSKQAVVIDLKSGKKDGNEIKHTEQGQLYTAATALRYPNIEEIQVEFWYCDHDDILSIKYSVEDAAKFAVKFEERGRNLTEAETFIPRPSIFSCRFCPYRAEDAGGTGKCEYSVSANRFVRKPPKRKYF